jgi:hypothetical protein
LNQIKGVAIQGPVVVLKLFTAIADTDSGFLAQKLVMRGLVGVSRWYAGRIRQGYRPHPRHWQALAELVGISASGK